MDIKNSSLGTITNHGIQLVVLLVLPSTPECNSQLFLLKNTSLNPCPSMIFVVTYLHGLLL